MNHNKRRIRANLIYLVLLAGMIFTLSSCGRQADPIFTMNLEVDFEIPPGLNTILTHTFVVQDVQNPFESFLETYGIDTSNISSVQAGRGEIISPFLSTDYEFVQRVSIWIVDHQDSSVRGELFYLDFNNLNGNNNNGLRLLSALSNVKEIVSKETFDLEIKLDFRQITTRLIENRFIFSLIALE